MANKKKAALKNKAAKPKTAAEPNKKKAAKEKPAAQTNPAAPTKQQPAVKKNAAAKKAAEQKPAEKKPVQALADVLSDQETSAPENVALASDAGNEFIIMELTTDNAPEQQSQVTENSQPQTSPRGTGFVKQDIPLDTTPENLELPPLELVSFTKRIAQLLREEKARKILHENAIHDFCKNNSFSGYFFTYNAEENSITGKIGTAWHKEVL